MSDLIRQLREDHRNARQLLQILSKALDRVAAGERSDYELLADIMRYLTQYPDLIHHPAEEELMERFQKAGRTLSDVERVKRRLGDDHRLLAEQGRSFRHALGQVVDGGLALRDDLVETGKRYVEAQHGHMTWEESEVFERANDLAPPALDAVEKALASSTDPLFGPVLAEEYRNLWSYIQSQISPYDQERSSS